MNRLCGWWLCVALWLAAGAAAAMPGSIVFSEDQLQDHLARRFPIERRLFEQFELRLADPSLRLDAATARLSTALRLSARDQASGRSAQGRVTLGYALRYEPADASVRLVRPRVESFEFDALPGVEPRRAEATQRVVLALAELLLDDLVLYRVPKERLDMLRAIGFRPGKLNVTREGLEITIEPALSGAASAPGR